MNLPITIRAFRSSGPGGQHRNTTLSAIEASVTLPDGRIIRATSQTERDQSHNKRLALTVLKARVRAAIDPGDKARYAAGHERVRTYHEPDNRVTDHASGRRWCHMIADTRQELLVMAKRIGLKSEWIQLAGRGRHLEHFDLVPAKRAEALRAGAIEMDGPAHRRFLERHAPGLFKPAKGAVAVTCLLFAMAAPALAQEKPPAEPPPKPALAMVDRFGACTVVNERGQLGAGACYRAFGFKGALTGLPVSVELVSLISEDGLQRFGGALALGLYRPAEVDARLVVTVGIGAMLQPAGDDEERASLSLALVVKVSRKESR